MFPTDPSILQLRLSLPSLVGDSPDQSEKRHSDAEQAMNQLFRYAVALFGESEARRMWTGTAKNRRGAPKGSRDPGRDRSLLELYDRGIRGCATKAARARLPGQIGKSLYAEAPARYGNSPEAISKQVRRLVHERHKQQRVKEEETRLSFDRSPIWMSSFIGV
jgi:hypothetical protein